MKQVILQPVPIYRLFIRQKIEAIQIERDFALLRCKQGDARVDLSSSTLSSSANWFKLRKLTLTTPHGTFDLAGLPESAVASADAAIQEAQRRKGVLFCLLGQANQISEALAKWEELRARDVYLTFSDTSRWRKEVPSFSFPTGDDADLFGRLPLAQQQSVRQLMALMEAPQAAADQRNHRYVTSELAAFETFFDNIESNPLTDQQRQAIVHDEDNALIIAGAGTGKTSTIVGKVGYILKKGWTTPKELLVLAFTDKAVKEMQERIDTKLGMKVTVLTFHALGQKIIAGVQGKKPTLCPEATDDTLKRQTLNALITDLLTDDNFRQDLLAFQSSLRRSYKPTWEFKSLSEYTQYLLNAETRSLSGILLKSYEECEIANWLVTHGIPFVYECSYEVDTASAEYRQYKPDFYLTEQKLYIEHWGVNRNGDPAPFMDRDRYLAKMKWALDLHAEYGTTLVETYSWEKQEGVLLTELEAKLRAHGVDPRPIPVEDALNLLNEKGKITPFVKLAGTFLSLYKSADYTIQELEARLDHGGDRERAARFLRLFGKLAASYEALLRGRGEIDFDDMITLACKQAQSGGYQSQFRYILVDEFQDIAAGRAKLILALRDQVEGAKLFCVGDDWQSIYRFTGSDISLTTVFDQHFGFTRRTPLNHTFRFHDKIASFSSRFVQQNPNQIRKELSTQIKSNQPGVVVWTQDGTSDPLDDILAEIAALGTSSVFLLARYHFLFPKDMKTLQARFKMLTLRALTAHSSKGSEADFVVILGMASGKFGFPSEIADDPVLGLVLADGEQFEAAEERRLFYVALTRARERVYLISDATKPSAFVSEILSDVGYEKVLEGNVSSHFNLCPICKRGQVLKHEGDFGLFYGCSNYPVCTYRGILCSRCERGRMRDSNGTETECTACAFTARVCPRCTQGILAVKHNRASGKPFWACSRYGSNVEPCNYTESMNIVVSSVSPPAAHQSRNNDIQ